MPPIGEPNWKLGSKCVQLGSVSLGPSQRGHGQKGISGEGVGTWILTSPPKCSLAAQAALAPPLWTPSPQYALWPN